MTTSYKDKDKAEKFDLLNPEAYLNAPAPILPRERPAPKSDGLRGDGKDITSSAKPADDFEKKRAEAKQEEERDQNIRLLFWLEFLAKNTADEEGVSNGSSITSLLALADAVGLDTTPVKQFIEKVSGKSYAEFKAMGDGVSLSFAGYTTSGLDGDIKSFGLSNNGSLRDQINENIVKMFHIMDPLKYQIGSRTGRNGSIDCSGFVGQLARSVDTALNGRLTKLSSTLNGTSESIYVNAAKSVGGTGRIGKHDLERMETAGLLQPGMIISTDKGATRSGFDANRKYGIDHIVMTAEKNGRLVIMESRSGAGVTMTDFNDWIKTKGNTTFFVTDMVKLAQNTSPAIQNAKNHHAPAPTLS